MTKYVSMYYTCMNYVFIITTLIVEKSKNWKIRQPIIHCAVSVQLILPVCHRSRSDSIVYLMKR